MTNETDYLAARQAIADYESSNLEAFKTELTELLSRYHGRPGPAALVHRIQTLAGVQPVWSVEESRRQSQKALLDELCRPNRGSGA